MNKSRKDTWIVSILMLFALIGMMTYTFIIQPKQQKNQQLENYRAELYSTMWSGMDLCGDRLDRENTAVFSNVRDTFRIRQGMLSARYSIAYDYMSAYNTPKALLVLGEYCSTRNIPTDYAAYGADSHDTAGQFIYLCTNILYDALGTDSQNMEDILSEIEADARTDEAVLLIQKLTNISESDS